MRRQQGMYPIYCVAIELTSLQEILCRWLVCKVPERDWRPVQILLGNTRQQVFGGMSRLLEHFYWHSWTRQSTGIQGHWEGPKERSEYCLFKFARKLICTLLRKRPPHAQPSLPPCLASLLQSEANPGLLVSELVRYRLFSVWDVSNITSTLSPVPSPLPRRTPAPQSNNIIVFVKFRLFTFQGFASNRSPGQDRVPFDLAFNSRPPQSRIQ